MSFNHYGRRFPPLRSVHVFEVASRHESFTEAAQELGVTQSAVSRQVQELERSLGQKLFLRSGPNLKLTATGKAFSEQVGRALGIIHEAVEAAAPTNKTRYVTLSMLPSVATKWLAPRLSKFVQSHPGIDLRIAASRQFVDFNAEQIDAAIRYGKGNWPGLTCELLAKETVSPVCTRNYASYLKIRCPGDLLRCTLLHSEIKEDWRAWFLMAGLEREPVPRGPMLGDDAATLQAALDSQGIALGRSVLVAEDLEAGRLIAPFTLQLQASYSYWFVTPSHGSTNIALPPVRDWLKKEFA